MTLLKDVPSFLLQRPISPQREMGAYEALWLNEGASFKTIANLFREHPGALPSTLVDEDRIAEAVKAVLPELERKAPDYQVRVHGSIEYPEKLRDAAHPLEFFYYRGWWDLAFSPQSVAVVGTRDPSPEGVSRTRKLVRLLVQDGYTIYSGLAKGVDTAAHTTAIGEGGRTVAVIGTPITENYPKENKELQERIAKEFLVISQVPILRYKRQSHVGNRLFFPERNVTMSAFTDATIIVEAGETSGTLTQARAALAQGRKLFILDSCFNNPALTWPARFEQQGAIRVREYDDIKRELAG